jgi:PAS domain-containing protein
VWGGGGVRAPGPLAVQSRDGAPAVLSAPALADGEPLGVLVVTGAAEFGAEDARVLEALAAIAGSALARLRMVDEHTAAMIALQANEDLELRVEERTRELAHANDALAAEVQQHRAAREELLQRTLELEVVFRALPDLYFRLAADGRILSYRAGAENGLYVPPEVFLNRRMQDVLPADVGEKFDAAAERVRATGQGTSIEYTLDLPDGERGAFEARIVPLVPGELAAVVRDITSAKQAEAALRASEESYRGLFDHLTELVYILDLEGRFVNVNEAVLRAYGYTREELLGQTPAILADE